MSDDRRMFQPSDFDGTSSRISSVVAGPHLARDYVPSVRSRFVESPYYMRFLEVNDGEGNGLHKSN